MKSIATKTFLLWGAMALASMALVACGGAQATSKAGMSDMAADAPPPPSGGADKTKDRKVSRESAADFKSAVKYFKAQEAKGWTTATCTSAAKKFLDVASANSKLVEARYNAGVSYQMCGDVKKAESQYSKVLSMNPNHAPSLGNLGQIYFLGGNETRAKEYWERAFKANQKEAIAAGNGLAWLLIKKIRVTKNRSQFKSLEKQAARYLTSVLAVENSNVEAYVLYSLLYQEGSKRNKSRLDIAKLLLTEGEKHDAKYAPLHNARGLLLLKKGNVSNALTSFRKAVELDPKFVEAKMNVGNIVLGFRKYDEAKVQFEAVLKQEPKNYDALIGLGIAQRGLRNLDAAESSYKRAMKLDGKRGDAYYNLGVLYFSFRANQGDNLQAAVAAYKKAKGYYEQYLSKSGTRKADVIEAKATIKDATKNMKQLEEVIRQMKSAPKSAAPVTKEGAKG